MVRTASLSAARILVTGATGFVGGALVRRLLADGLPPAALKCLVRDPERARRIGLPEVALVPGDLGDRKVLESAASGVDVILHLAGAIKAWNASGYLASNRDGTENLVRAALAVAPEARFVHVSSLAAAGPSVDGAGTDLPPDRCNPCSRYGESKRQGELAVVGAEELRWLILRPPLVYGAGDAATRLLFRQATARVTPVPFRPRLLSLIHVHDLVRALKLAAECEWSRRILPLEGPNRLTTHEMMAQIAAACGRRARLLPVPVTLVRPLALAADLWARLRRRAFLFSYDKVRELAAKGWVADPTPAREVLDFVPAIPTSVGFVETAREEGFVAAAGGSGE